MSPLPGPLAATFLDLPAGSPGGSVELFLDLYTGDRPLIPARAFMLAPADVRPRPPAGLELLSVPGKCLEGPAFGRYVAALRQTLASRLDACEIGVLHLQHLAFGATPALMRGITIASAALAVSRTRVRWPTTCSNSPRNSTAARSPTSRGASRTTSLPPHRSGRPARR